MRLVWEAITILQLFTLHSAIGISHIAFDPVVKGI